MKGITGIALLAIILMSSCSNAQIGHGMMRGGNHMMGGQGGERFA